jgi:hypothetical protein
MSIQSRNIIIIFFLAMSFIPFMLITDLFPFMRFGMFAETIQDAAQKEIFQISVVKADGSVEPLSKRQIAMDNSHLNYLARTYFYNNRIEVLSEALTQSGLLLPNEKLLITQQTLNNKTWTSKTIKP